MIETKTLIDEAATVGSGDLSRQEEAINKVAWFGGIAVTLVTVACFITLIATADVWWQYVLYTLVSSVPLAYAMFCSVIMRHKDLSVFNSYRQQLTRKLTDLQELVFRDELTGLSNRRHFYETVRMEVEKARVSRRPLAIMLLDLDGLKKINDEHGHGVGDAVLGSLGRMMASHTRGCDVPCRLGGDEFGIIMPGTDKRGAFSLARRLWESLEATPMYEDGATSLLVTVSIGLAGYPWGGETVEEMIQWADADMYANKVSRKLAVEAPQVDDSTSDLDTAPEEVFGSL